MTDRRSALEKCIAAYLDFARGHPVVYEAMVTLPTDLRVADAETGLELVSAVHVLAAAVRPSCTDGGVATEMFWAALHGLVERERSGRLRPGARVERLALVFRMFLSA